MRRQRATAERNGEGGGTSESVTGTNVLWAYMILTRCRIRVTCSLAVIEGKPYQLGPFFTRSESALSPIKDAKKRVQKQIKNLNQIVCTP